MPRPWDLTPDTLAAIAEAPIDRQPRLRAQYTQYARNSFLVPFQAAYAILGCFAAVMILSFAIRTVRFIVRPLLLRKSKQDPLMRLYINQLLEAPLFKTRRAAPYEALGGAVSVRAPGRLHTLVIMALCVTNLVTVFAFHQPVHNGPQDIGSPAAQYTSILITRSCSLIVAQLPLVFALSGRNSPVAWITGAGFNTLMLYHRWFARLVTFQAIVHGSSVTHSKLGSGGYAALKQLYSYPFARWGATTLTLFTVICAAAYAPVRRRSYDFFLLSHIVMVALVIAGLWHHLQGMGVSKYSDFYCYLYASMALWIFERITRTLRILLMNFGKHKGRTWYEKYLTHATCRTLPDGTVHMRIYLAGWAAHRLLSIKAGQHVYVNLPSIELFTMHPFSVLATGHDTSEPYIDVAIQPQAGFTRRVAKRVLMCSTHTLTTPAFVEGAYGHPISTAGHDKVVLVAGGIGITHCLAVLIESLRSHSRAQAWKGLGGGTESTSMTTDPEAPRSRSIDLIWSFRDPRSFCVAIPYIRAALVEMNSFPHPATLRIQAFVTSKSAQAALLTTPPQRQGSVPAVSFLPVVSNGTSASSTTKPAMQSLSADYDAVEVLRPENEKVSSETMKGVYGASAPQSRSTSTTMIETGHGGEQLQSSLTLGADGATDDDHDAELAHIEEHVLANIAAGREDVARDLRLIKRHAKLDFDFGTRPKLHTLLDDVAATATATTGRLFVTCCGAAPFGDAVRAAVRQVRTERHLLIDFHDECFAW